MEFKNICEFVFFLGFFGGVRFAEKKHEDKIKLLLKSYDYFIEDKKKALNLLKRCLEYTEKREKEVCKKARNILIEVKKEREKMQEILKSYEEINKVFNNIK